MSVAALQFLWQIEEDLEKEFARILAEATANVYVSVVPMRDAQSPWLEITFLNGRVNERRQHLVQVVGQQAVKYYDTWTGSQLEVKVATNRANNYSEHKVILGRVRSLLQLQNLAEVWEQPVHSITDIREQGTLRTVDTENDMDYSTITFSVNNNINPSAWPVATPPPPDLNIYLRPGGVFTYLRPGGGTYVRP